MAGEGYATYVCHPSLCLSLFSCDACVLGVVWRAGGALGIYLARDNQAYHLLIANFRQLTRSQRNVVPGLVYVVLDDFADGNPDTIPNDSIILTGWVMSEHAQSLKLSTKVNRF